MNKSFNMIRNGTRARPMTLISFFIEKVYNALLKYDTTGYTVDISNIEGPDYHTLIIQGQMPSYKFEAFMSWLTEFMRVQDSDENIEITKSDLIKRSSFVNAISKAVPYFSSYYDFSISLIISKDISKEPSYVPRPMTVYTPYDDELAYGTPLPDDFYPRTPSPRESRLKHSVFGGKIPKFVPKRKASRASKTPSPPARGIWASPPAIPDYLSLPSRRF